MSKMVCSRNAETRCRWVSIQQLESKVDWILFPALGKKMAKKGGKLGPVVEKKIMPVETDANKLVSFVCGSNIYIKGEDIKVRSNNQNLLDVATLTSNLFAGQTRQRVSWLALVNTHRTTQNPGPARPWNEAILAKAQANRSPTKQPAAEDQKVLRKP